MEGSLDDAEQRRGTGSGLLAHDHLVRDGRPQALAGRSEAAGLTEDQVTELVDDALSQVHEVAELFL